VVAKREKDRVRNWILIVFGLGWNGPLVTVAVCICRDLRHRRVS